MSQDNTIGRAKAHLGLHDLAEAIGLPKGTHIVAVQAVADPVGIFVIIEGPSLPVVEPGAESPIVPRYVTTTRHSITVDEREVTWPTLTREA